jgi:hypothetical protein
MPRPTRSWQRKLDPPRARRLPRDLRQPGGLCRHELPTDLERHPVYGTIDGGVTWTWRSHGAPFNGTSAVGVDYLIQKYSRGSRWDLAPNGLSQSNIGIKGKEPLAAGWTFIFDLQAGFDPYSLHFANEPHSVAQNAGIPLTSQDSNADSSRAGQFYNSVGYLGVSSPYGTLTVFRQNSLTLDAVFAYDPMGASLRLLADRLAGNYLRRRRYRRLPIQHVSEVSRRHWPVQGCGAVAIRRLRSEQRRDRFLPVPTRWRHSQFGRRHAFARRYRQLRPERRVDRACRRCYPRL